MTPDSAAERDAPQRITVDDLVIDRDRFVVTVAGQRVELTYMEFEALYLIAIAHGRVAPYATLAAALWGDVEHEHRSRLAVIVSRIRAKLGPGAGYLQTARQVGYRLGGLSDSDLAASRPSEAHSRPAPRT